jgi:hypothetical protein
MIQKSAAVQRLTRPGVLKSLFGPQIPALVETLIRHVRAPRGLIATPYTAKSEGA